MKLITPDDLSTMLAMPRKTVIDSYVKQEGFPQSVSGWRKPRWLEDAVLEFWKAKSAQKAQQG